MPRASADDRCPGAVRLHEAADGFVGRVRIPGGRVSAAQLRALATLASSLGDGHLYLTSRGNVQLRGLGSGCGQELADGLHDAGLLPSLTHDRVRNVVASPLGGLTGHPATEAVLDELDTELLADDGLVALSGRFLFGIDNGTGDVLALAPDVAVVLESADVARLAVAGTPTAVTAPVDLAADLLIGAAHRFLGLRASHAPNAWRAKELPAEALAELAPGRPGPVLSSANRPVSTGPGHEVVLAARSTGPRLGTTEGAIVAGVPLGSAPAEAWLAIAGLAGQIRFTPWRSVVLVDPAPGAEAVLATHGFLLDGADPLALVTSCIGQPGCAKALADVRADAPTLAAAHPGVRLHLSGCDRRCGHPTTPHLSAVADGTSYTLEQH
ncbi:precorrin-3B synthase [Nocardioides jiangxiensis]|uniref:Precorrin-3B synthase n=1 Tax=Nocardioides jiangxiensis TaxID=3064524 RepID=A0ABT9AZH3_9ACTN|nr:precorrin-3B synthase [Nocardioides sp. WY-20]MDO7867994.1 precorrin-3B synthase [Nocardioides sp. WY-20]